MNEKYNKILNWISSDEYFVTKDKILSFNHYTYTHKQRELIDECDNLYLDCLKFKRKYVRYGKKSKKIRFIKPQNALNRALNLNQRLELMQVKLTLLILSC